MILTFMVCVDLNYICYFEKYKMLSTCGVTVRYLNCQILRFSGNILFVDGLVSRGEKIKIAELLNFRNVYNL